MSQAADEVDIANSTQVPEQLTEAEFVRQEFLKSIWRPYPPAQSEWWSVREFCQKPGPSARAAPVRICGRLRLVAKGSAAGRPSSYLTSDDEVIECVFGPETHWDPSSLHRELAFRFDTLTDGDWIAIAPRSPQPSGAAIEVDSVILLAPHLSPGVRGRARRNSEGPKLSTAGFSSLRAREWMHFLNRIRQHFQGQDFIEAQTPTLVPSPGTEPFLDPFSTRWEFGSHSRLFYLPTSPEFHLKKLLARGWSRIFEFKTCFRNGEIGAHHQPEFQMLEWYRAFANLDAIAEDVNGLFQTLGEEFKLAIPELRRTTMKELFAQAFPGFELRPQTQLTELLALAKRSSVAVSDDESWDDVFFRLFLEKIEPGLGLEGPMLVRGYPPTQAALSRIGPDGFADRFEVYWRGMELANAFHELNDPDENERRFQADAALKVALGKPAVPIDEELLESFAGGMPPAGGIALGLDRLFMALWQMEEIRETRAFAIQIK